jgi:hypothetical protein
MFSKISNSIPAQMLVNSTQGQNATRRSESEERATTGLQALRQKQQKERQESLAAIKEMQKNLAPKKQAAARAGRLKQRLEMLRDMLAKMPPGNYKALAQELKQIAKELAALGKSLGSSGSAITAPALNFQADTDGAEAGAEGAAASGGEAEAAALAAAAAEAAANTEASSGSAEAERLAAEAAASANAEGEQNGALDENGGEHGDRSASKIGGSAANGDAQDDKALRALLVDAKKLFKQVADLLKAKMLDFDKEAKKIFEDIDRSLRKLDDSLRGGDNPLYSALGELSPGGDGGETAASGISINVSA